MKRYLHIGGSKDGQMLEVKDATPKLYYTILLDSEDFISGMHDSPANTSIAATPYDVYEFYTVATSEKEGISLYVWTEITLQQALVLLLMNYVKMWELKCEWKGVMNGA